MRQTRIQRRARSRHETISDGSLDPRDLDVVRAKQLTRSEVSGRPSGQLRRPV